jgi:RHS repeat-associated protein
MEYDAAGRLTRRLGGDGLSTSFGYDAVGRRIRMSDITGTTQYSYDPVGRLVAVNQPDGSVFTSAYDAAGRRVEFGYADGLQISYRYDANGSLIGLFDPRVGDVSYTLDADNRVLSETLPGDWSRSYRYDGGLLVHYSETRNGAPITDTTLTRDADGRIIEHVEPTPGKRSSYTYDAAGQLLSATGEPGGTMRATYDAVGNRTSITRGNVKTQLTYDAADQLIAADTGSKHVAYRYDGSGRLLERTSPNEQLRMAYDTFGQPTTTTEIAGGVTHSNQLTYNGDGLLVQLAATRDPGTPPPQIGTVSYQWSVGEAIPQILTQRGEGPADFVYGYHRVFADTPSGSATFSRDIYGSALRTSETEPWVQAQSYDVFGQPETAGTPSVVNARFGYRGELAYGGDQPDGTLLYLRSRTYDATVGRFTSRDPVTAMIGQTDTASPYAYGNNSPLNFVDPRGKWSLWDNVFQVLGAPQGLGRDCPPPDNSTRPAHPKCFQGQLLSTRGFIPDDCLDAREYCLNDLWNRKPRADRERAAQAFTINELNKRREGFFHRLWDDQFGFGTAVSLDVDWEVKPPQGYAEDLFRIDIVTNEKNIFEVKDYKDAAQVEGQLGNYLFWAFWNYGIQFERGTELQDWANAFSVYEDWWDVPGTFGGDDVYVWGLGNPAGHVYFAKEEKAPVAARVKADRKKHEDDQEQNSCTLCFPIPIIPRVPVPVPVVP